MLKMMLFDACILFVLVVSIYAIHQPQDNKCNATPVNCVDCDCGCVIPGHCDCD